MGATPTEMGATPTEMGVTPPGVNNNHPIHAPTSLGPPWGAQGPMGPRCAVGVREALSTLVFGLAPVHARTHALQKCGAACSTLVLLVILGVVQMMVESRM